MRKNKIITISDGTQETNRDFGKNFLLTEMSAGQAERWAARAFLAIARTKLEVPPELSQMGFAGIAIFGLQSLAAGGVNFEELEPLLAEMMDCVRIIPNMARPEVTRRINDEIEGIPDDIEEVATRVFLRQEVFNLHTGFWQPGGQ